MLSKTRITVIRTDAKSWSEAAKSFSDLSYRQCPAYQHEAAASNQAKAEFILLQAGGQIQAVCSLRVKTVPILNIGVAYAHHAPLTMRNAVFSPALYSECVAALAQHYVERRKLALRIVPPDAASLSHPNIARCLENNKFQKLDRTPRHTIMVDLDRPLSAICQSFDGKWRNHLRQSAKHDLRIETTSNPDDFAIMATMLEALEKKKAFHPRQGVAFFTRVQRKAPRFGQLVLYIGYYEGQPVSTHLCSFAGSIVVSLLAATNDKGREIKASRRMQWRVIEDAVKSGKRWYDTGGVDPHNNPGVYSFKKGMNGLEITEVGLYERRPGGLRKLGLDIFERIYRKLRLGSYGVSSMAGAVFLWMGPASTLCG